MRRCLERPSSGHNAPMIKHRLSAAAAAMALAAAILGAAGPAAADTVGQANYSGLVQHVSSENVKVTNPRDRSTMSFLLVPHFKNVFSSDGKTTYQMSALKEGQYVKVFYDQKALGARHADRILTLNNANMPLGQQKG
jgi:hypothetical protein